MSQAAPRRATYDDLVALPENVTGELIDGVLYQQPRPRPTHAVSASRLQIEVGGPFDRGKGGPGGWWIIVEPECHLSGDTVVPDLAGWRREHLTELPDTAWFALAPDWVCEVLSPSTARKDRIVKQAVYAREGVSQLWFIDPDARTLEAFSLAGGNWTLVAALSDADEVAVPPFAEAPFALDALWA